MIDVTTYYFTCTHEKKKKKNAFDIVTSSHDFQTTQFQNGKGWGKNERMWNNVNDWLQQFGGTKSFI